MFYECFNTPFTYDCGIPALNIYFITIDDSTCLDKIACYTPDLISASIYVASEKYVTNLTTPYDPPQVVVQTSDDTNPHHAINKYNPDRGRVKIGYCSRQHSGKICCKKSG